MAAETRKDVELHIRARDYSRKTIDDVTGSLEKLVKQQDEQLDAAKRGEVGLKALEAAYGRLESAGKALLSQNAVIETFKAQTAALEQTRDRVDAARRAHQAYSQELAKSENPTRTQVRELNKLATAVTAAERAQLNAEARLSRTTDQMSKYGISTDDVAGAQDKLLSAVNQVNRALEAQDKAIESLDEDSKAAKEREAFERTRAENLRRMKEAEVNQIWQVALAERDAIEASRQAEIRRRDELAKSAAALDSMVRKYNDVNAVAASSMVRQDAGPTGNADEDLRRAQAAYDAQINVVRRLREDYKITREQARELAEQMRSGAITTQGASGKMEVMQRSLATTSAQFQNATKVARENRSELNRAVQAVNKETAARNAQRAAAARAADDADTLRRRYAELARVGDSASMQNLQKSIREIINPTQEAAKTLAGLETNVGKLSETVANIRGPVRDYKATVDGLSTAMKTASTIAGQIDGYRTQLETVGRARREYVAARDAVANLSAQMRAANAPTSELTQQMTSAQARLRQAADQMRNSTQRARELRQGLRDAAVDTRNLADAEAKLTNQAQKLNTATTQLTDAYRKYGAAAESAGKGIAKWFSGQRTTLSYFQRMRGEVLALATGFVGVQSAVNLAGSALDAYRSKQAIESRLSVVVGNDAKAIREEWDYLMGQSNRLGFAFEDLALSYSKFGVAAKASGSSQQEIRFIFERIAEGARVAKMTTDDFNGSMKAIEQMMSKGQITAEELRQQLGDRLPGAMALAAKGAGYTVAEFSKLMELGQISSDFVINLAKEVGDSVADRLDDSLNDLSAIEGRFKTAVFQFKLALAENGFVDAYSEFIEKLTNLLKSEDGRKLAQTLSEAFTLVVQALQWAAENVDILAGAFAVLIGINVIGWLTRLTRTIRTVGAGLKALFPSLTTLKSLFTAAGTGATGLATTMGSSTRAVSGLGRSMSILINAFRVLGRLIPVIGPAIAVAWGAWDLYKHMSNGASDAEEAGKEAGEAAAKGFEEGMGTATPHPGTGGTRDTATLRALRRTLGQMDERTRKADAQSRLRQDKADLAARLDIVSEEYEAMKTMARENVKDQEELSKILEEIEAGRLKRVAVERRNFETEQARAAERGGSRRVSIARQVADELAKIEDELAKNRTAQDVGADFEARLTTRLAAVGHEYDKLRQKIETLARTDKAAAAEAAKRLDVYVETRKQIEEHKVRQEELTRLEGKVNEHLNARTAMLAEVNAQYQAGVISQEEAYARTVDISRAMTEGADEAINKLREFAQTMQSVLSPAAFSELMAKIGTMSVTNDPETQSQTAALEQAEANLNNLLNQRAAILDVIAAKRKEGIIDDFEQARLTEEANGRFRDQIQAAALQVENLALAMRNPANAGAMDLLIAKMQQLGMEAANTRTSFTYLDTTITNSLVNNAMTAIEGVAGSLANMINGTESVSEGFANMGIAAANFFAQFLKDIAMAILRQQLLNALTSMGGGIGGVAKSLGGVAGGSGGIFGMIAGLFHSGGTVGAHNPAVAAMGSHKRVSPSVFSNAPRMHTGGLVGLSADEVPTILQENEEVLAKDDPRNILNGGAAAGGGSGTTDMNAKFVVVDDPNRIPEAMTGAAGQQVFMSFLKQNAATVRAVLK